MNVSPWGRPTGDSSVRMQDKAVMSRHWQSILTVVALLLAAGCSPVNEPWVRGDDQLKQERARSAEAFVELRERLAYTQNDR